MAGWLVPFKKLQQLRCRFPDGQWRIGRFEQNHVQNGNHATRVVAVKIRKKEMWIIFSEHILRQPRKVYMQFTLIDKSDTVYPWQDQR